MFLKEKLQYEFESLKMWYFNKSPLNIVILIVATFGISYQLYDQTSDYLNYPIFSQVHVKPYVTRLPAITYCISFWYSEKEDEIKKLTILEASKRIPSVNETLGFCNLTLPNGTVVDCLSITKIHYYMNSKMWCYAMFEKHYTLLDDEELMYNQDDRLENNIITPLLVINIKGPFKQTVHWSITVRKYDRPFTMLRSTESKVWLEPDVNEYVWLNYLITDRTELPSPYPEDCTFYKTNSVTAFTECWLDNYNDTEGNRYWPDWTLYDFDKKYSREQINLHWASKAQKDEYFASVNQICYEKFNKIDCKRSYIRLVKIAVSRVALIGQGKNITAQIPWMPAIKMVINSRPKFDFFAYTSEIGGIFSMWIGFSLYMSLLDLFCPHQKCPKSNDHENNDSTTVIDLTQSTRLDHFRMMRLNRFNRIKSHSQQQVTNCTTDTCDPMIKVISSLIKIASTVITTILVYEIVTIYFEVPFSTTLVTSVPKKVNISRLTLCFNLIVYPEKMKKFYPKIYETVEQEDWRFHLTIEQLFKVTLEWNEISVPASSTYLSAYGENKIEDDFNYTKSLTGKYVCFSTFGPIEHLRNESIKPLYRAQVLYASNFNLRLNTSQLLRTNQTRIRVYIHDSEKIKEDSAATDRLSIIVNPDPRVYINSYVLRVSKVVNQRYPHHILSKCLDYASKMDPIYPNVSIKSREAAIDHCVEYNFLKKHGQWPMGHQIYKPSKLKFNNESLMEELFELTHNCALKLSRPDCSTTFQYASLQDEFFKKHVTSISLYPPSKQFYRYKEELVYSIVDIIGYTGGTVNAWIGWSFLDLEFAILAVKKFFNRYLNRMNQQTQTIVYW